jgi:hypothetical protein
MSTTITPTKTATNSLSYGATPSGTRAPRSPTTTGTPSVWRTHSNTNTPTLTV